MSENLVDVLKRMQYPGRAIIPGRTDNGELFVSYILTGRSGSSKARRLVRDKNTNTIHTESTDDNALKGGNAALLLYPAVTYANEKFIASNGAQTELIYSFAHNNPRTRSHTILDMAFEKPSFRYDPSNGGQWADITSNEPDSLRTPRISILMDDTYLGTHLTKSFVRTAPHTFGTPTAGEGYLLTTYEGNPIDVKPFMEDPVPVSVPKGGIVDITKAVWDSLIGKNEGGNFRVAVATMVKSDDGKIRSYILPDNHMVEK